MLHILGDAGVIDQFGFAVQLYRHVAVDEQVVHPRLVDVDGLPQEFGDVDAGADHAQHPPALLDQHIDPDLGDAQMRVRIDVDLVVLPAAQRGIEPLVVRVRPRQRIAQLLAGELVVRIVEIVMPGTGECREIAAVAEVQPIGLQHLDRARPHRRVVLVQRHLQQCRVGGHLPGQRDLARQRQQRPVLVEHHLASGKQPRPLLVHLRQQLQREEPCKGRKAEQQSEDQQGKFLSQIHGMVFCQSSEEGAMRPEV